MPQDIVNNRYDFSYLAKLLLELIKTKVWFAIIVSLLLSTSGLLFSPDIDIFSRGTELQVASVASLVGAFFIFFIMCVVLLLVSSSVMLAFAGGIDLSSYSKLGGFLICYFMFTTVVSGTAGYLSYEYIFNGLSALFSADSVSMNTTLADERIPNFWAEKIKLFLIGKTPQGDLLMVLILSLMSGASLATMKERAEPLFDIIYILQEMCMNVVLFAMKLAPYAVFGLTFHLFAMSGISVIADLLLFSMTVILGLILYAFVFYGSMIKFVAKRNFFETLGHAKGLLLLAFASSSSSAVMPITMSVAELKLKIDKKVASFVVTLGATINMDGTCFYQVVAFMFASQLVGYQVSPTDVVGVVLASVVASIGTPGAPGASMPLLMKIMEDKNIDTAGVTGILGVDRILDMVRTVINVLGDLTACAVMEKVAEKLEK